MGAWFDLLSCSSMATDREEIKTERNKYNMKTTHTPGPWTSRYLEKYGYIIENIDKGQMQFGKLADVMPRGGGESAANAALIAAAPDLLAALSMLIDRMDQYGNIDIIRDEGPIEDARAAIQKATGEA
jgi:hypothetical protein